MILTKDQANKRFTEVLNLAFNKLGFTADNEKLIRQQQLVKDEIIYEEVKVIWEKKLFLSSVTHKYIDPIDDCWIEFIPEMQLVRGITSPPGARFPTLAFNAKLISDYTFNSQNTKPWFRINEVYNFPATEEGFREMTNAFIYNTQSFVVPLLDAYNDIELLDACINQTPDHFFEIIHLFSGVGLFYKKIIIAKLAGNKDYELICEACRKKMLARTEMPDDIRDTEYSIFERLYEKLKVIPPLSTPVLY